MNIEEAMVAIIEEAERQGFRVMQTRDGAWALHIDGGVRYLPYPHTGGELLRALQILIAHGLDWSRWD